jgi:hypothetical protein
MTEKFGRRLLIVVLSLSFVICSTFTALAATSGTHYPFGIHGVIAATAGPPGFHYLMYNTFYSSDTLKDDNGDKLNVGFEIDVFANVHRFIYTFDKKILGADPISNVIIPVISTDLEIGAFGADDSKTLAVGDIFLEPLALAWHGPRYDAVVALAAIAPTGEFDINEPASAGLGYWSAMLTLGGTVYFDDEKTWSFSALTRTLFNGKQEDTNVRPGTEFVVEWGLGKQFPLSKNVLGRPGIAGCNYWQVSDDSDNFGVINKEEHKENHALGGEMSFFWLPPLFQVNLRYLWEFGAKNTAEGTRFVITLTKSW